jgi:hypothetical protein
MEKALAVSAPNLLAAVLFEAARNAAPDYFSATWIYA